MYIAFHHRSSIVNHSVDYDIFVFLYDMLLMPIDVWSLIRLKTCNYLIMLFQYLLLIFSYFYVSLDKPEDEPHLCFYYWIIRKV